jgi:hypothetical protein
VKHLLRAGGYIAKCFADLGAKLPDGNPPSWEWLQRNLLVEALIQLPYAHYFNASNTPTDKDVEEKIKQLVDTLWKGYKAGQAASVQATADVSQWLTRSGATERDRYLGLQAPNSTVLLIKCAAAELPSMVNKLPFSKFIYFYLL